MSILVRIDKALGQNISSSMYVLLPLKTINVQHLTWIRNFPATWLDDVLVQNTQTYQYGTFGLSLT